MGYLRSLWARKAWGALEGTNQKPCIVLETIYVQSRYKQILRCTDLWASGSSSNEHVTLPRSLHILKAQSQRRILHHISSFCTTQFSYMVLNNVTSAKNLVPGGPGGPGGPTGPLSPCGPLGPCCPGGPALPSVPRSPCRRQNRKTTKGAFSCLKL